MAGAHQVVCPFFGVVFEKLNTLIFNVQINKLGPLVKDELTKLFKTFLKIKEVIDDAEEKQFNEEAVRVRFWLHELNDAAYEADDVFDEVEYEVLQQGEGTSSSSNKKRKRLRKQRKIQKLIQIFDKLAEECLGLELQKGKERNVLVSHDRITDPLLTEPTVYGRDEDREELVKQLLGPAYVTLHEFRTPIRYKHPRGLVLDSANNSSGSQDNFSVFPLQGMGGLGKTTLAKMVYNDERVQKHFDFRSWVCISTDFDTKRIMKEIVASLPRQTSASKKLELQKHFHEELRDKRFLVVLDDVWDVTQEEWNEMKAFFRVGGQGNSVIVTTRLSTAACITGALHSNCISGLSDKNCWKLFKQYAFGMGNEERPALVKIGKEIVKKCQGLPLVAKALGGLLRFKDDENEWLSIKDSAIWNFENDILPALRLSYHHLPTTLKRCFVYCSLFPKDYEIRKNELIQLWMANGLLEQSRANIELEDTGNGIFNALLWRSFFQDIEKDEDGNIIICKMHDLVHDLASYIAGDEYFVEDTGSVKNITKRTCYVSLSSTWKVPSSSILEPVQGSSPRLRSLIRLNNEAATLKSKFPSPRLRSLIRLNKEAATLKSKFVFSDFILLRALDLNHCGIGVVPDCIGEMKHLRYLNLSYNYFRLLPECICLLRSIQTLKLRQCSKLESLPKNIGNMSSLRHLDNEGCQQLSCMPIGIGLLTRLISLSDFIVGKKSESGVDGLHGLNYLRGELKIDGLEHVETTTEAAQANLTSKKNVHSLELNWAWAWYSQPLQRHDQNVIEGLQPHSNLRKLKVAGYKGVTLSPSWLTEKASSLLPNLVQISLIGCTCEHLGSLRKLHRLKILELSFMGSLKFIEEGEVVGDASAAGGFPSLEELKLVEMPDLEGWSSSSSSSQAAAATAAFPCLKKVVLFNCPKIEGVPLAWSPVEDVDIFGGNCNGMVLGSLRDLPCLSSLRIDGFEELEYFPRGTLTNLTALQKLEIRDCPYLKALLVELKNLATLTELLISSCANLVSLAEEREGGLKNLSSLKTLVIRDCEALKRLPELHKASLVILKISDCPEMEFSREDFEHLVVLEELLLAGLPKLTCFPEGIKHSAATLRILTLVPCHTGYWPHGAPVDLPDWIGTTLTSLEYLRIVAPKNWNVLPPWMQHLTALKTLVILRCDQELVKRWESRDRQREVYNIFNMISHVPDVELRQ